MTVSPKRPPGIYGLPALIAATVVLAVVIGGVVFWLLSDPTLGPPRPSPYLAPRYAVLRADAREACYYRSGEANTSVPTWLGKELVAGDFLWSGRYMHEQLRLERLGHPTPTENTMFAIVCPDS